MSPKRHQRCVSCIKLKSFRDFYLTVLTVLTVLITIKISLKKIVVIGKESQTELDDLKGVIPKEGQIQYLKFTSRHNFNKTL